MDSALSLSLRYTLNAVYARLEFKESVGAVAYNVEYYFLETASCTFVEFNDFYLPAFCLAVSDIHSVEVASED